MDNQEAQYSIRIGRLAYERLQLQRRIEEIDKIILQIEGAQAGISQVKADLETQRVVNLAKSNTEE